MPEHETETDVTLNELMGGSTRQDTLPVVSIPPIRDEPAVGPGHDPGDPGAGDPGASDAGASDPGASDPGASDPGTGDLGAGGITDSGGLLEDEDYLQEPARRLGRLTVVLLVALIFMLGFTVGAAVAGFPG